MKKLIVTGATGYIGLELVKKLKERNYSLLLVGRNKTKMKIKFPDCQVCTYEELEKKGKNFFSVIHLAVANNDQKIDVKEFEKANVYLVKDLIKFARRSKIKNFFNLTSLHTLTNKDDNYVKSKKSALVFLESVKDVNIFNIFSAKVYGNEFKGTLGFINKSPSILKGILFYILSSLAPVVTKKKLIDHILFSIQNTNQEKNFYVFENKDNNFIFYIFKLSIDLSFSFAVLIGFSWLLIIISILIKTTSGGPVFFSHERLGKSGKRFKLFKFRTMKEGTKNVGTHNLDKNSITSIGLLLRKTKLDELPQVINILRGEMSLVGPRPGLPSQKSLYRERKSRGVLKVKPGITGYSQINGIDMRSPKQLAEWDQKYIALRCIVFEIKLIFKTFIGGGQGDRTR